MAVQLIQQLKRVYPEKQNLKKRIGIKVPFEIVNSKLSTISGDELNTQDIAMAFSDTYNKNPFFQDTVSFNRYVFKPGNAEIKSYIVRDAKRIFASFERKNRFRLIEGSVQAEIIGTNAIINLDYEDMESREIKSAEFGLGVA